MRVPSTSTWAPFLTLVRTASARRGRNIATRCHSTFETHSSSAFFQERCVATERTVKDRKSTRLNSSHVAISYAVFCLKKKKTRTAHNSMKLNAYSLTHRIHMF